MALLNGPIIAAGTSTKVTISKQTRDWCARHGLDIADIPNYLLNNTGQSVDVLRLSPDQLARVPKADRPTIIPEEGGRDFLAWFPLTG